MLQRHLTVTRAVPISRARYRERRLAEIPFIRISGRWLEKAGFGIGKGVRVIVREGVMVLEVMHAECD